MVDVAKPWAEDIAPVTCVFARKMIGKATGLVSRDDMDAELVLVEKGDRLSEDLLRLRAMVNCTMREKNGLLQWERARRRSQMPMTRGWTRRVQCQGHFRSTSEKTIMGCQCEHFDVVTGYYSLCSTV